MTTTLELSSKEVERAARSIHPGEWAVEQRQPIATLLGSCVAVCLYDPRLHIGGMNHFMLPTSNPNPNSQQDDLLRGDYAMEVLVNAMLAKGASKSRMIAKAFGGGNIIASIRMSIGERNAEFASEWLAREGIALHASDFGGPWSRKVLFAPDSGVAWCRRMLGSMADVSEVARKEADYARRLIKPPANIGKKIELF